MRGLEGWRLGGFWLGSWAARQLGRIECVKVLMGECAKVLMGECAKNFCRIIPSMRRSFRHSVSYCSH